VYEQLNLGVYDSVAVIKKLMSLCVFVAASLW
jgi:hypothetical protein